MRGLKLWGIVLLGVLFLILVPATYAAGYGNPQEIGPYNTSAWQNAWADYNGDGYLDFIQAQTKTHSGDNHKNTLYLGDGYGGFTSNVLPWSHQSYSVAAADFDKDGDMDVAVGNFGQNYLYVNDGHGNFAAVAAFGSGDTIRVSWGDCNGDGYPDLAVANRGPSNHSGQQNYLYVNNGNGTFTQHAEFGNGATYSITWGDYNGDGKLDAAVANYGQNYLYVNNGSCNFTAQAQFGSAHTLDIAWGDFDGNGDLDAAVMNGIWPSEGSYSTDIQNKLYVNNGDGTFTPRSEFGTRNSVSASWGDVDGDGDLDLAVANVKDTQPNTLYINNSGTFTEDTSAFPGNYWTARGAFVDIGGNGTLEFAISQFCNESGCPAAVWWNGAIGDYVWKDSDQDGIQDSGESGLQNVSVTLHQSNGNVVAKHYTDKKGHYLFADVPAGDYYLAFGSLPSHYYFSPKDQGSNDAKDSDADPHTGRTVTFTVAQGQQLYNWDAGLFCSYSYASVGDRVWEDLDRDGIQDADESGISGVTVELYKSDDTFVASTTTDADGNYHFYNLQTCCHYYVKFILPNGYVFSPKDQGWDDAKDSDADPSTGKTNTFSLSGGCNCNKVDAGMYQPCIQGFMLNATHVDWVDNDHPNDSHYGDNKLHVRNKTDGNVRRSYYYFDLSSLPAGSVTSAKFMIDPTGGDAGTMGLHETNWNGTTHLTWNTTPAMGSLLDTEYYDGGKDTQLFDIASALAGHPSTASFMLRFEDDDTVPVTTEHDDHENPRLLVTVNICTGADLSITKSDDPDPVLEGSPLTYTLSVANNGPAEAQNVVVTDSVPSELQSPAYSTDGGSSWQPWTGTLSLGTMASGASQDILIRGTVNPSVPSGSITNTAVVGSDTEDSDTSNNSDTEDTTVIRHASIGDFVWHDLYHSQTHEVDGIQDTGEPGIAGVVMELYDSSHAPVATTTTDTNGHYTFTGVIPGNYTVKVADSNFAGGGVLAGWYASPQNAGSDDTVDSDGDESNHEASVTLSSGEDDQDVDFGFYRTGVSLTKTGPQSVAAGDVITYHFRVENTGDLVLHGGAHVYDPLINPGGDHEIWTNTVWPGEVYEFDKTYTPDPSQCGDLTNTATVIGHPRKGDGTYVDDVTDQASWTVQLLCNGSLGDFVWNDTNADGIQDSSEPGLSGVTVDLYSGDSCSGSAVTSTTTDGSGNYSFTNLTPGTYSIKFVLPSTYTFSPQNQGSDDAVDSDADTSTGCSGGISLSAGENDMTWDAGMYQAPSVAVDKSVPQQDNVVNNVVLVGNTVNFQVVVTNTGATTLAYIPLHDQFDDTCLRYSPKSANPQENNHSGDSIDWVDLTLSFGHDLQPGEAYTVTIPFQTAAADDNAVNTAVVQNAEDVNNQIAPDAQDQASVICKMPASIGDRVWNDTNGNGLQDAGEPGIGNVTVKLYKDNGNSTFEPGSGDTLVATKVTSGDGAYDFTMLYAGSYWVDVDESTLASGYSLTTANEPLLVAVNYGDDYNDADFGYAGKGDIAGTVWYDWNSDGSQQPGEDGIPNVEVCLYQDNNGDGQLDGGDTKLTCQNTASDGTYIFHDQMPGDYLVVETQPAGMDDTTPNVKSVQLIVSGPSGSDVDNNFGDIQYASVGDFVYSDVNGNGVQDTTETQGIPNATLHLTGTDINSASVDLTTTSDVNGSYAFNQLLPGDYQVQATPPTGYTVTSTNPQSFHLNAGDAKDDVDFGLLSPTAVQVVRLQAQAAGHNVTITWQTASEEGVERFVVERYAQGVWNNVGEVPAVGLGDNSYRFTEQDVPAGRQLYRIVSEPSGVAYGPVEVTITDPGSGGDSYRMFLPFTNR